MDPPATRELFLALRAPRVAGSLGELVRIIRSRARSRFEVPTRGLCSSKVSSAGSQAAGGSRGSVPCCSSGGPGTHRRGGCRSHLPPSRPYSKDRRLNCVRCVRCFEHEGNSRRWTKTLRIRSLTATSRITRKR